MRIMMIISYDGANFCGFQRQKNARNIQGTLEAALSAIYDEKIEIKGAGRTDAGVHANYQVIHYDAPKAINKLKDKVNNLLPKDIYIKKVKEVSSEFHARKSVKKKKYIYYINIGPYQTSLNNYCYQVYEKLDINLMKECSKIFLGTHDFENFVAGKRDDYTSTIYSIKIQKRNQKIIISFTGVGFYRYMVRNLVGALIEVGKCKISINKVRKLLNNPKSNMSLPTAPPQGLYLQKIWY